MFEDLFGSLQTNYGYTPEQVRAIELPDIARLSRYSKKNPPLRDLVEAIAKAIGIDIPNAAETSESRFMTGEELKRLVDATGGRIDGVGRG